MNTSSFLKQREIQARLEEAETAHRATVNKIKREAYENWVSSGAKTAEAEDRRVAQALARKTKYNTSNGVTIHKLRQAGVKVSVNHIRYSELPGIPHLVPVPSYLRSMYDFYPRGGVTHITLVAPAGESYGLTSICHMSDSFDYKLGVKLCLEQLEAEDAEYLLSGLDATKEAGCVGCTCDTGCVVE